MDDQAFAGTCPTCGQAYLQAENARLEAGYREILHIQSQTEHVPQWIVEMATEKLRLPSYYSGPFTGEQSHGGKDGQAG